MIISSTYCNDIHTRELLMRNTIRSQHTVSEDELKNIKELDWDSYYRESAPADLPGLTTCPDCGAIIIVREKEDPVACYGCGRKI